MQTVWLKGSPVTAVMTPVGKLVDSLNFRPPHALPCPPMGPKSRSPPPRLFSVGASLACAHSLSWALCA